MYGVDLVDEEVVMEFERCRNRITELSSLTRGWDGEDANPIAPVAVENAKRFLGKRPSLSPIFRIYPVPDGAIAFEFEADGWDYTVEFQPIGSIEFYGVEMNGPGEHGERKYDALDESFLAEFDAHVAR